MVDVTALAEGPFVVFLAMFLGVLLGKVEASPGDRALVPDARRPVEPVGRPLPPGFRHVLPPGRPG